MCKKLLIFRFAENVITMLMCSMTHEMQLIIKNDDSLLTFKIEIRNLFIQLVMFKI